MGLGLGFPACKGLPAQQPMRKALPLLPTLAPGATPATPATPRPRAALTHDNLGEWRVGGRRLVLLPVRGKGGAHAGAGGAQAGGRLLHGSQRVVVRVLLLPSCRQAWHVGQGRPRRRGVMRGPRAASRAQQCKRGTGMAKRTQPAEHGSRAKPRGRPLSLPASLRPLMLPARRGRSPWAEAPLHRGGGRVLAGQEGRAGRLLLLLAARRNACPTRAAAHLTLPSRRGRGGRSRSPVTLPARLGVFCRQVGGSKG